jgi:excisionase family DNA binding protein
MRANNELEERYADVLEAGKRLGIHPESARRLMRQGRIPGAFRFGNKWLVERDRLEQFALTYNGRPGPKATLI